jgi:hypothetical protein
LLNSSETSSPDLGVLIHPAPRQRQVLRCVRKVSAD